jgi:hypothetical protein
MRYNLSHRDFFRLTSPVSPAEKAHHNWVLPLLDLATPQICRTVGMICIVILLNPQMSGMYSF